MRESTRLLLHWTAALCFVAQSTTPAAAQAPADTLVAPVLIAPVSPIYPEGESTSALVELELTLDAEGQVTASDVTTSAGPAFDASARTAAEGLRFSPALRNGVPIPSRIPFRFELAPPPPPASPPVAPEPPPSEATASPPAAAVQEAPVIGSVDLDVRGPPPLREATRHSLDTAEVRTIPGTGGDVLRSVESMPGVARPAFGEGMLVVRGSAPSDSQVFVDGTSIPYAYHFGDATSVVPGDMLDRLDFFPGNFGPEFGRGMGGVIDVGLRSPRRDRFGGLVQIDMIDARAMIETPLGPHTGLMIGARRSWLDAWVVPLLEGTDASVRAAPVYWDGQISLEHDFSASTRARLSLFGADDRFEVLLKSPDPGDPAIAGELGGYTRFVRAQLRVETELASNLRWQNTLSWGLTDMDQAFGNSAFAQSIQEVALRSDLRADLNDWLTFIAGLDAIWLRDDVRARFRPYPEEGAPTGPSFARPLRSVDTIASLVRPALYTGLEIRPVPELRLMPSVRADYTHDTEQLSFDPRFGARWDVVRAPRRTTLKGGVGLYHQPPSIEQSADAVGTAGLENNRALHTSLGIEQEIAPGFELSVEGFYKRLSHLVVARADETRLIGVRFENTGQGNVYGAEALVRWKQPGGPFLGWVAYTLSRSERRSGPSGPYTTFEWDQTHVLSAVAQLQLGRGWTVGARFRYVTGSPYTPYSGGVLDLDAGAYSPLLAGAQFSQRLGAFHQLDLRVEKLWDLDAVRLSVYLELRNAYNRENPEGVAYSYDYAERDVVSGLPILPVLGLRGEL